MPYSLFLGPGPLGQIELFSAFCKKAVDDGMPLEEGIDHAYQAIKELSGNAKYQRKMNPFPGYGNREDSLEVNFTRFHPEYLYTEYAMQVIADLAFPLVVIEKYDAHFIYFNELVNELGLSDVIIPQKAGLEGASGVVRERGLPRNVSGAHFLSISAHQSIRDYGDIAINGRVPHDAMTSLMGDRTQLTFLEEGDLVYDEGQACKMALKDKTTVNGIKDFEDLAGQFFTLGDTEKRDFEVRVFPREYLTEYDRDQIDYGQVLVTVKIRNG